MNLLAFSSRSCLIGLCLMLAPAAAAAQDFPPVALGAGLAPQEGGVRVARVMPGLTAASMGIQVDDVIVEAGGKPTPDQGAILGYLATLKPGDVAELTIERGGQKLKVTGKAMPRPAEMQRGRVQTGGG